MVTVIKKVRNPSKAEATVRMTAIMQNIIANKGTFVP